LFKSNTEIDAEIGYWCSASASGIMTNALHAMIRTALHAGFQSFIAYTRPGNMRSVAVLNRLGFSHGPAAGDDGRLLHGYRPEGDGKRT
jgi:RimJ/RimL family protein N-acetyltransferase